MLPGRTIRCLTTTCSGRRVRSVTRMLHECKRRLNACEYGNDTHQHHDPLGITYSRACERAVCYLSPLVGVNVLAGSSRV